MGRVYYMDSNFGIGYLIVVILDELLISNNSNSNFLLFEN